MYIFYYCMVLVAMFFITVFTVGHLLKGEWKQLFHDLFWEVKK